MARSNHAPSWNPWMFSREDPTPLERIVTNEASRPYVDAAGGSIYSEALWQPALKRLHPPSLSFEQALKSQRAVLKKLKAWHIWDTDRYKSLGQFLMSKAGFPKRSTCPSSVELFSLATYFFPQRRSLKVVVCDFGEGLFERHEDDLENVEQRKPEFWTRYEIPELKLHKTGKGNHRGRLYDGCMITNSKMLDAADVRRHVPLGSGSVASVRQFSFSLPNQTSINDCLVRRAWRTCFLDVVVKSKKVRTIDLKS